jgi:hypothetical protein
MQIGFSEMQVSAFHCGPVLSEASIMPTDGMSDKRELNGV